jgi:CheY-like chemotaxis protein
MPRLMTTPVARDKRILIIAEDVVTRTRMVQILEDSGYTCLVAQDSVEVLTLVDTHTPHAVVLHANVPSSFGLDVLRPLRIRRAPTIIPAILLSSDASMILDGDSHLPTVLSNQPITLDDVLAHVDRLTLPD